MSDLYLPSSYLAGSQKFRGRISSVAATQRRGALYRKQGLEDNMEVFLIGFGPIAAGINLGGSYAQSEDSY